SELPDMITSMRHPRQRAISVGPVSEADAYETLAYREKKRRESGGSVDYPAPFQSQHRNYGVTSSSQPRNGTNPRFQPASTISEQPSRSIDGYENMMGCVSEADCDFSLPSVNESLNEFSSSQASSQATEMRLDADALSLNDADKNEEIMAEEMFRSITRPRVRYDVEVVTKRLGCSKLAIAFLSLYATDAEIHACCGYWVSLHHKLTRYDENEESKLENFEAKTSKIIYNGRDDE
ncbi:hypothetical protein KEM54_006603, partial [Ascosphaera aggregata]